MRGNKAKKPSRAIQYLLSADRQLRKLSLKKMSEPATKIRRPRRSNAARPSRVRAERQPAKRTADVRRPVRIQPTIRFQAVVFTVVGIVAAATLVIARPRSQGRDLASVEAHLAAAPTSTVATVPSDDGKGMTAPVAHKRDDVAPAEKSTKRPAEPTPVSPTKPPAVAVASGAGTKSLTSGVATSKAPQPQMLQASSGVPANNVSAADSLKPVAAAPNGETEAATDASVTITGCLEGQPGAFRLKDPAGVDAPKVRGWKTGFLKKRPAPIELLDPGNRFTLADYVGQRVAATGVLSDREMRPRSLHRVATSCK